ncbi:Sigma70 r4 2 domain containing protein [Lysobacter dokdonensis DS-58]|uniref:Sigma70 r4 2 domain containing protein n=1 Tax=Lysobacter dokdonensis DS-58 TaxID=1300345 RepID=A0A0A2WDU3_9GAMM|nr:sigma-70 family RNA polymerase sigma factor [Lysobacter dokdonensis]KGQ17903.1 Sigma70 r4 2 domain containing protein [Lysobacter dokdonensis DS-58]
MNADLEPPDSEAAAVPSARRPEVQAAIDALTTLERPQLIDRLRAAARQKDLPPEVLLHFAREASARDQEVFFLAFEGLTRCATSMIASQMRMLYRISEADLDDHLSVVFENLVRRIQRDDPTLEYGVRFFHSFILRRSIDAMKSKDHPWTRRYGKAVSALRKERGKRIKRYDGDGGCAPTEVDARILSQAEDPAERAAGQEELAQVEQRLAGLPDDACEAFLQARVLGRTQAEIAEHFGVSDRTVRNWLDRVTKALDERTAP